MNASDSSSLGAVGEHRIRLTELEAQLNLCTVLELCAGGELRCSEKTYRPSAATVDTLGAHLTHGDFYRDEPIASFAWLLLVQAGGLAKVEGGRLWLTAKGRTALRKSSAEVICQLWQRWLTHALIDESAGLSRSRVSAPVMCLARPRPAVRWSLPPWRAAQPMSGSAWRLCSPPCGGAT